MSAADLLTVRSCCCAAGKFGKIKLYENSSVQSLAKNFCKTYSLDETTRRNLVLILEKQLEDFQKNHQNK